MISTVVETAQHRLMETGLTFEGPFKGCSEQEILSIERRFGVQLPTCYRDFLMVMGRRAGAFLVGSDYSFPRVFEFRNGAEALLRRCLPEFELSPTAFVFFSHPGYSYGSYSWFNCHAHADDAPVFLYTDAYAELEPTRLVSPSFSAWLLSMVEYEIAAFQLYED
jgi:hypothetical protein